MAANESPPASRIGDDIHVDLAGRMTYGDYLQLDTLLAAKKPLTDKHDEHLFITIHHVQELWLNLMAHELEFGDRQYPAATSCRRPSSRWRG